MLSILRWLVHALASLGGVLKTLVGFGVLLPLALVLKVIGWPIMMVLGVLALPVLLVLFLVGLPIFLVFLVGGGILAFLFFLLSLGAVALKFALLVVLPVWLLWKLFQWMFGGGGGSTDRTATQE